VNTDIVDGGFADPVFGSQRAFRLLMDAFARPGTIADLSGLATAPAPLPAASAAFLLTLADGDTPVFFETPMSAVAEWTAFHAGAQATNDPEEARFVVLSQASDCRSWARYPVGTAAYPDRSATLLLPVASLDGGDGLVLSGPGIETVIRIAPEGLPQGLLAVMSANRAAFPLGYDLVLVADGRAIALPRTTRLTQE
jgi:alpha-D-ribose 1-methylphosphonate 5-triphosphate synthase subunit PhnH